MEKLLSAEEVADILGTTKRVVCYTLKIPYIKVAGKRMYTQKDIQNYIEKNRHYAIDIKPTKKFKFVV